MYQHSLEERQFFTARADQFGRQVARHRDGLLGPDEFQQFRLRNGLYMERFSPMIRVAIPYGHLSSGQLRMLANVADRYDRGYGHFTTRQNIQFNWVTIEDSPDLLRDLAAAGMHAIQTSGSCVRNITTDHLAGIAPDEVVDPRPWCELIRQWATLHPEFYWLPRKFKIAVSGSAEDRAAIRFHDIGIELYRGSRGEELARIHVGGGMGRTPVIGRVTKDAVPAHELLDWLHAIIHVYNRHGRRDNKYKARIKILVNDLGIEAFVREAEIVYDRYRMTGPEFNPQRFDRIRADFRKPQLEDTHLPSRHIPVETGAFRQWRQYNTEPHRDRDRLIVHLPLKSHGMAPGDMDSDTMRRLADIAEIYSGGEIRVTHRQNLVLPWMHRRNAYTVWRQLEELGLATPNIGMLTDMIACPGLDYCSLANASTVPLARELGQRLDDLDRLHQIGRISLKMSGCMNACGHHHAADIGVLGVDKKGEEWYQITLGGDAGQAARIGRRLGPAIPRDSLVDGIFAIVETYLRIRHEGEAFADSLQRTGLGPYQEQFRANHQKQGNRPHGLAA